MDNILEFLGSSYWKLNIVGIMRPTLPVLANLLPDASRCPQRIIVNDPDEASLWADHMMARASISEGSSKDMVAGSLSHRVVTSGSCFSGVETGTVSRAFIKKGHQRLLRSLGLAESDAIEFKCAYVIEPDTKCQEELLAMPDGPTHVFTDVQEFAEPKYRKALGLDGGVQKPNAELEATIPYMRISKKAWCVKHGCLCPLPYVDDHDAGPHCTDHSIFGKKEGDDGGKAKFLLCWVAIIRCTKPKRVFQENVRSYGLKRTKQLLGDLYVVIRILTDPIDEGWATMRQRQILVLLLKTWIYKVLHNTPETSNMPCSSRILIQKMHLPESISFLADRICNFTWKAYLRAPPEELMEEIEWAAERRSVKAEASQRRKSKGSPCLDALTQSEYRRWLDYQSMYPGVSGDTGQEPDSRPMMTRGNYLNTLIRNVGIMMLPDGIGSRSQTWWTASEYFEAMGFPIRHSTQEASGVKCVFSIGQPKVWGRTRRSMCHQVGNAMHVNSIGKVILTTYLKVPDINAEKEARSEEGGKATSSSSVPNTKRARTTKCTKKTAQTMAFDSFEQIRRNKSKKAKTEPLQSS